MPNEAGSLLPPASLRSRFKVDFVDPLDCFDYMYAELPQELVEQREEFKTALAKEGYGLGH